MNICIIHDSESPRHNILVSELLTQGVTLSKIKIIDPVYEAYPKIGVMKAHKNCIRYAKEQNWDYVIVMENDIKFTHPNSFNFFVQGFNELPEDWEIYLGGCFSYKKDEEISNNIHQIRCYHAFHFYAVSSKYYDEYLAVDENPRTAIHIDVAIGRKAKSYLRFPIPAIQYDGYSENFKKNLIHNKFIKKLCLYDGNKEKTAERNNHS